MITLDQIRQLDQRVRRAVEQISLLKGENRRLQEKLDSYQLRIEELEVLIDTFKKDQGEIENGIINALNQLDMLEDRVAPSEEEPEEEETEENGEEVSDEPGDEVVSEPPAGEDESAPEETSVRESELDIF